MHSFIAYFAQRSFLARIITIMVLAIGIGAVSILKLQELPDIAFPEVTITTQYPGASAQDIELNITNKIEKELRSVQGVDRFTSESADGRSYINLELDESSDIAETVTKIQQAVDRVSDLPKDVTNPPLVERKNTATFEIFTFGVTSTGSDSELQAYSRSLEKQLRTLSGVGSVNMSGFREREFWIEVKPTKVSRYQLTFDDVINAVKNRNLSLSGGAVESWNNEQRIVTLTQVQGIEELQNTIIKVLPGGGLVRLGDIAKVSDSFEKATQLGVINGQPAILFQISKSASADIRATIANVEGLFSREEQRLDGQFQFLTSLNLGQDMDDKFKIVSTNGGVGLLLVLIVLSLILKRQIAFWVSVSIPFCVLGVMAILPALDMNLDSITLSAMLLVIGIIVDDSVIVAESIYQEKEQGASAIDAAVNGTTKVIKPILASLTTTALVFIPMLFIPGILGKAVAVIPITVIAALLFSLAECTLTLPAHLANSLSKADNKLNAKTSETLAHNKVVENTASFQVPTMIYRKILTHCLKWKRSVIVIAIGLLFFGGFLVSNLKIDLFPSESAKYIEIYTEVESGTPLDKIRLAHHELEQAISALPSNELVSYEITYSTPTSQGLISLTNAEQRERSAEQIIDSLNTQIKHINTINLVKFTVDAGGPPPGEPVEVRVIGNNKSDRDAAVIAVENWMQQRQGLDKITHSESLKDPQLQIIPQYEWLARYGLTVNDLATTLRIAFDGDSVTSTWIGDEEVSLRVIMDSESRTLEKLRNTKIYTASGLQIPLNRLAYVEAIQAPRLLQHFNGERQVIVTAQITDKSLEPNTITTELTTALQSQIAMGIRLDIGGEAEKTNETLTGFAVAFPAAILGIYFVLAIMFGSLLQPLLVMSVIPFASVAAMLALFIHFEPLSLFALIGILGMTGVVVNNSLVLINCINELKMQGYACFDAVLNAALSRLRPILLTSITTVAGLLPLAYGLGGTDVYMGPMSLTLGYGLLFSLPVVLIVIPCLYLTFIRPKSITE
ncbi:efflux RND transporter permease subunit [Moritella sp. 24]|uniref:efflux RND transporter permease subunit n=1 Tax=Moritella sp. 24 TaxID=2746230 RepID=UPI001BAC05E6|nr:efflux RND transporter permease subunit [Moritella sp. 24]QUM76257.1 efflux RND transporter permease subunit [Moritella sp. 24]